MDPKICPKLRKGRAFVGSLVLSLIGLATVSVVLAARTQTPTPAPAPGPTDGSKEPIISQPDTTDTTTGITGTIQVPSQGPAPVASLAGGDATRYVIFAVRQRDWNDAAQAVPTRRPAGILGKFVDTWNYDGSTNNRHTYHFNVTSNQEGTPFYVVVQSTITGSAPTYSKVPLTIGRAN